MRHFWIGWGDICTRTAQKWKEADVESASGRFEGCSELVNRGGLDLATEIYFGDAVRVE